MKSELLDRVDLRRSQEARRRRRWPFESTSLKLGSLLLTCTVEELLPSQPSKMKKTKQTKVSISILSKLSYEEADPYSLSFLYSSPSFVLAPSTRPWAPSFLTSRAHLHPLLLLQSRIKKIMQTDEDVGKVAMATPVLVCESSLALRLSSEGRKESEVVELELIPFSPPIPSFSRCFDCGKQPRLWSCSLRR